MSSGSSYGQVVVVMKIYPKGVEVDLKDIVNEFKERIDQKYRILKWEEEYIAFGYKALRLYVLAPEELEGGTEELENIAKSIEAVDNVDIELVSRVMF
ncbi:MAG: elongation factor 1-beta [Thermoprotei archaeon]|nr:MAG: elongation factor 1-beta [Thermoprotei archaeon]